METTQDRLMQTSGSIFGSFMAQIYGWMSFALIITFAVAFGVEFLAERNLSFFNFVAAISPIVIIGQLILVLILSFLGRRMNAFLSAALFIFHSITMGIFFGVIFLGFTTTSIFLVFGGTIATFIVMSVFGLVTKQDLTSWGRLFFIGLIGLFIATILNIIMYFIAPGAASILDFILTYVGIALFLGLIAYHSQQFKVMSQSIGNGSGMTGLAIQAALTLYLDFINLFIRLLGVMGKRR